MTVDPTNLKDGDNIHDEGFSNDIDTEEMEHGRVLYRASFEERKETYVSYRTTLFLLGCIIFTFAYGFGLFMFFYIPVYRYICRKDMENRRLYIITESVVYKTAPPVCFPCCGLNRTEMHILLPLVTDVVVGQGCIEARYGIHTISIKNAGGGSTDPSNKPGMDVSIQGINLPREFKKVLLWAASLKRNGQTLTREMVDHLLMRDNFAPGDEEAGVGNGYAMGAAGGLFGSRPAGGGGYSAIQNNEETKAANEKTHHLLEEVNDNLKEIASLLRAKASGLAVGGSSSSSSNSATLNEEVEMMLPSVPTQL